MLVSIENKSKAVTDDDCKTMAAACNVLLPTLSKVWNLRTPTVAFCKKDVADWVFNMIDEDPNEPDALAYHTVENDHVDGYILCKTILDNGGVALYKDATTPTIASALFHEIAEALMDEYCNGWWSNDNDPKNSLVATEVCDPVQDNIVPVTVGKVVVGLSDFIYPAWADSQAKSKQLNYLNTLKNPFELSPGGYVVLLDSDGQTNQVFGAAVPNWVKKLKQDSRRNVQRRKRAAKICNDQVNVDGIEVDFDKVKLQDDRAEDQDNGDEGQDVDGGETQDVDDQSSGEDQSSGDDEVDE